MFRPIVYALATNPKITIENTSRGVSDTWAARNAGLCLSKSGEWIYEPGPSHRDEQFLSSTRFTFDEIEEFLKGEIGLKACQLVRAD